MITNTNSAPAVAAENLSEFLSSKTTTAANRANPAAATEADESADRALLSGTDSTTASYSDTSGLFPDAAAAEQGMGLARQNMLTQPGTTLLAQANLSPESVLKLLG